MNLIAIILMKATFQKRQNKYGLVYGPIVPLKKENLEIDHLTASMGILVHPNYKDELANGVGVTKNIYIPDLGGMDTTSMSKKVMI